MVYDSRDWSGRSRNLNNSKKKNEADRHYERTPSIALSQGKNERRTP